MRKAVVYNIKVCVDVTDYPSAHKYPEASLAVAADLLQALLTEQMQMFCQGKGNLIDWTFANFKGQLVNLPEGYDYQENDAFGSEYDVDTFPVDEVPA
jgi:hypothetical protein